MMRFDPNIRRLAVFYLEDELLIEVLNGTFEIHGWPDDAEVVSVNACWERRAVAVLVRSATFEMVPCGQVPPILGNFNQIGRRTERVMMPNGTERIYSVSANAERIELPDGRVQFREFL